MGDNEPNTDPTTVEEVVEAVVDEVEDVFTEEDSSGGGGGANEGMIHYLRGLLLRMRLPLGPFSGLIRQAVGGNWTADEFLFAVSNAPAFRKMFPGIQSLFDQGMGVAEAVASWRKMSETYQMVAQDLGYTHVAKLTPKKVGILVRNGVDAEEFGLRLMMLNAARHSEAYREAFNRVLKQRGDMELDKKGWFRFLMGKGDRKLYDTWESVQLLHDLGPEGLSVKEARQLGRAIGGPGQLVDTSMVLASIHQVRQAIGSGVLKGSGIETDDLALVALSESLGSSELKDKATQIKTKLEQMLRNAAAAKTSTDMSAAVSVTGAGRPITSNAPVLEGG